MFFGWVHPRLMKRLADHTDEDLVIMAQGGSQTAFDQLVDRYALVVYRVARCIAHGHQDAEDIVQETFLRAFKSLDRFSATKASFRTWLLTIARNQSINVFSSLKRKAARFIADFDPVESGRQQTDNPLAVNQQDAETLFSIQQEHSRVQKALRELPERQRTALLLKAQENMSYEEIAEVMASSSSAVESLIFRGRKKLLELLEE
jgi:RNA polymerase sigma-70 factor, ECF subfamily